MKFKKKFSAKLKIAKVYSESCVKVEIIEASEDYDSNKCFAYGTFLKAYEEDVFECEAWFEENDKFGFIMRIFGIPELSIPSERKAIAKYSSAQIAGVSVKTMECVYDAIGNNFVDKLNENPDLIKDIGIKESQKESILKWCRSHICFSKVAGELYLLGLSPDETVVAYRTYGSEVLGLVKEDPYQLFYKNICRYTLCDKIYGHFNTDKESPARIRALVYFTLKVIEARGDMAVVRENYVAEVNRCIKQYKIEPQISISEDQLTNAINWLTVNAHICEIELDKAYCAIPDNYIAEKDIARYLKNNNVSLPCDRERILSLCSPELLVQQKEAIVTCLTNKLSIVTGGPGTGKTYTIRNMIQVAQALNPKLTVALMAPTGKAASRMIELINQEATTIHARLGLSENDDLMQTDGMIIDEDLVIIDEASMVDEKLFGYFVRHISQNSQVVLVGDSGQLPSVGAGNLLEEMLEIVPYTELRVTKRSGSAILNRNAQRVREKKVDQLQYDTDYFAFIEEENDIVSQVVQTYIGLTMFGRRPMILAPQYNGPGVDAINSAIQRLNDNVSTMIDGRRFKIGDRVIQTKNTKKLGVHNGDQGEIVNIYDNAVEVLFDGYEDSILIKDVEDLKLAYCITTHKSQGSEEKVVIMVFSPMHQHMLTNKLIYTGITRAKEKFIGVGVKKVFEAGIIKDEKRRLSLITKLYEE